MSFDTSIVTMQLSGDIDMQVAGVHDLTFNSNPLHIIGVTSQGSDVTGFTTPPTFNIGTNAPDYDNIISSETSSVNSTGACFQRLFNGNGCSTIPMGSFIKINITTPATGITNVQRINLIGYPIEF